MVSKTERPVGVLLIVIFGLIGSVGSLISAVITALILPSDLYAAQGLSMLPEYLVSNFVMIGIVSAIIGLVGILAYVLLLQMKKNGWFLVFVIGIFSLSFGLINLVLSGFYIPSLIGWIGLLRSNSRLSLQEKSFIQIKSLNAFLFVKN